MGQFSSESLSYEKQVILVLYQFPYLLLKLAVQEVFEKFFSVQIETICLSVEMHTLNFFKCTLREKSPCSEFFWFVLSQIRAGSSPNAGRYAPEKLLIRTLFTQWQSQQHQLLKYFTLIIYYNLSLRFNTFHYSSKLLQNNEKH